ncbi:MAG: hypothetical protein U0V70_15565 [Terriglobia bacterium]
MKLPPPLGGTAEEDPLLLDEVIDALDDAFDNACLNFSNVDPQPEKLQADDAASIHELFCEIASHYSVPMKNLIFAIQSQSATRETVDDCRPILQTLSSAAENIGLQKAVESMAQFDAVLAEGQASVSNDLQEATRLRILDAYQNLAGVLPEIFELGMESQKREEVIIQSLLQGIPGLARKSIEKLHHSGLNNLSMYYSATPEDLAAATGIQKKLCTKICETFGDYHLQTRHRVGHSDRMVHHVLLTELVEKLHQMIGSANAGTRKVGTTEPAGKKPRQQGKSLAILEIQILLAELGELDLLQQFQKATSRKRVKILQDYLSRYNA